MYDVSARIDESDGGRFAEVAVTLPVPADVVWDAVSTGEGISSWFVPCALEPHVGGRIVQFADPGAPDPTTGPDAAAEAVLTATVGEITELTSPSSSTPGRFTYAERDWMGEGVPVPPWETSCEVRGEGPDDEGVRDEGPDDEGGDATRLVLRSGFAQTGQLAEEAVDGSLDGWATALTVLAHRLTHRPETGVVTVVSATDPVEATVAEVWQRVLSALVAPAAGVGAAGVAGVGVGDVGSAGVGGSDGVGAGGVGSGVVGQVARAGEVGGIVLAATEASAAIVLSGPADGVLTLFAYPAGETADAAASHSAVGVRVYEYVDAPEPSDGAPRSGRGEPLGAAAVDGVEPTWDAPRWREWLVGLLGDA